jgi:tRNA-binding protein
LIGVTIGILKHLQNNKTVSKEDLRLRQIVAVVNFPKKQIGKFMSECLVLGAVGAEGGMSLLAPDLKSKTDCELDKLGHQRTFFFTSNVHIYCELLE